MNNVLLYLCQVQTGRLQRKWRCRGAGLDFSMHVFYSVNPEKFPCGDTGALSLMLFQYAIVCKISLNMLFVRCLTRCLCLSLYACVTLPPSPPYCFPSGVWCSLSGSSVIVFCPSTLMGSCVCIKECHWCAPRKLWQYQTVSRRWGTDRRTVTYMTWNLLSVNRRLRWRPSNRHSERSYNIYPFLSKDISNKRWSVKSPWLVTDPFCECPLIFYTFSDALFIFHGHVWCQSWLGSRVKSFQLFVFDAPSAGTSIKILIIPFNAEFPSHEQAVLTSQRLGWTGSESPIHKRFSPLQSFI